MAPRRIVTTRPPRHAPGNRPWWRVGRVRGVAPHDAPPSEPGALVSLLIHAYENGLLGFVRRRCRTRDDAEDALQETMVAALRSMGSFRGESRFDTWLHAVAANSCRRLYRRGIHDPHPAEMFPLEAAECTRVALGRRTAVHGDPATPEQHLLRAELTARIANALVRLPENYRTVVLLRDRDGRSSHATAAALRLSCAAMKSRLHRARTFLRRALGAYIET